MQSSFGKCSSVVPFTWEHEICETWKEIPTWHEVFMAEKDVGISQFPSANFQEDHWVSRFRVFLWIFWDQREETFNIRCHFPIQELLGLRR